VVRAPALVLLVLAALCGPVSAQPPAPAEGEVDAPVVRELWPAAVPAGRALTLEVIGDGFTDDMEVHVEVNAHAGSRRAPEYTLRPFSAERIDEQTLEVRFDRGFYGTPALRDVVVVHPDGRRSDPARLRITDPEPTAPETTSPIPDSPED
jgi:hypothetical protein